MFKWQTIDKSLIEWIIQKGIIIFLLFTSPSNINRPKHRSPNQVSPKFDTPRNESPKKWIHQPDEIELA